MLPKKRRPTLPGEIISYEFLQPCYTPDELEVVDEIVEKEKKGGKKLKAGKVFDAYIGKI